MKKIILISTSLLVLSPFAIADESRMLENYDLRVKAAMVKITPDGGNKVDGTKFGIRIYKETKPGNKMSWVADADFVNIDGWNDEYHFSGGISYKVQDKLSIGGAYVYGLIDANGNYNTKRKGWKGTLEYTINKNISLLGEYQKTKVQGMEFKSYNFGLTYKL